MDYSVSPHCRTRHPVKMSNVMGINLPHIQHNFLRCSLTENIAVLINYSLFCKLEFSQHFAISEKHKMLEFSVSKYTICWKFRIDYINQIWYNISVLREPATPNRTYPFFLS